MHWAAQYISRPWVAGARGPEAFDCWGLIWWCERVHFGRELPLYPIPPAKLRKVAGAIQEAVDSGEWIRLDKPVEGCAVGLSLNQETLHHVGIYTAADRGMVLHAAENKGVMAQSLSRLRADGWSRIEFYWHASWQSPLISSL